MYFLTDIISKDKYDAFRSYDYYKIGCSAVGLDGWIVFRLSERHKSVFLPALNDRLDNYYIITFDENNKEYLFSASDLYSLIVDSKLLYGILSWHDVFQTAKVGVLGRLYYKFLRWNDRELLGLVNLSSVCSLVDFHKMVLETNSEDPVISLSDLTKYNIVGDLDEFKRYVLKYKMMESNN